MSLLAFNALISPLMYRCFFLLFLGRWVTLQSIFPPPALPFSLAGRAASLVRWFDLTHCALSTSPTHLLTFPRTVFFFLVSNKMIDNFATTLLLSDALHYTVPPFFLRVFLEILEQLSPSLALSSHLSVTRSPHRFFASPSTWRVFGCDTYRFSSVCDAPFPPFLS